MSAAASESTRRLPRSGVLVVVGLAVASVGASVGAVMALAHGTARPIAPSIGSGIVVIDTNLAFQGAVAAGTGMVLTSSGEVLTNNHVISGATTIKVVVPKTGHSYRARVLGYDRTADVAEVPGVLLFIQRWREDQTGRHTLADSQNLNIAEEKRLVFFDGTAQGPAKLVLAELRTGHAGFIGEEIVGVELVVAQELIKTAVEFVGPGLSQ